MKKRIFAGIATGMFLTGMGGLAQAVPLTISNGTIDVGDYDALIAANKSNESGDDTELAWINTEVNNYLFTDSITYFTSMIKIESDDARWDWYDVSDNGYSTDDRSFAFKLKDQPDYFMIKTGNNLTNDYRHYLFKNIDNLNWAVINLDLETGYEIKNYGVLSHINQVGGTPVPEPATMLLFGTGLVGLAGLARRKAK